MGQAGGGVRRVAVVGVVAASLALVACGGQGGMTAVEVVARSGVKAAAARTARLTLVYSQESGSAGTDHALRGTGFVDFTSGLMSVDLPIPTPTGTVTEREVVSGKVVFVAVPANRVALLHGKHWISVDLSTNPTAAQGGSDPSQAAKALQSVQDVSEVGRETLGGVSVTHYRATMNPSALYPGITGADALPIEAWVDGQGRLRQEVMTIDYSKVTLGGVKVPAAGVVTITTGYSDFGVQTAIVAPNPSDSIGLAEAKTLLSA